MMSSCWLQWRKSEANGQAISASGNVCRKPKDELTMREKKSTRIDEANKILLKVRVSTGDAML
jgi:hypothetical protein